MITDRISLQLISLTLKSIEANEGKISNINVSVRENNSIISKLVKFPDLLTLDSFINQFANLTSFVDMECTKFTLYELKSFKIDNDTTRGNFVLNSDGTWKTKYPSINAITVQDLNTRYLKDFLEVKKLFDDLGVNEYILTQHEYIDCGYIETHFAGAVEKLIQLYNKYR